jgi:ferrochelatase
VFDAIANILKYWRWLPELRFVTQYYDFPDYIEALATHIQAYWQKQGIPDRLLFSFHGLPKRFAVAGDPYPHQCQETVRQIVARLALKKEQWQMVFQSRFGREEWLQPYTDHTLIDLGKSGIRRVDVICPGFAADCLETLEEINQQNRQLFLQAGGEQFHYIPALNDGVGHIQMLLALVNRHTQGWFSNPNG